MQRQKLIAGNWKMNTDLESAAQLAAEVAGLATSGGDVEVAVCPPFISLEAVSDMIRSSAVELGAQNMHQETGGAFTGEISAPMLVSAGCKFVILGHSERRQFFGETDESINQKVVQALAHDLVPIVCVGETLEQRDRGVEREVVRRQVEGCLRGVKIVQASDLVLAYEPVWAIGTGRNATPAQAQEMHRAIRRWLEQILSAEIAAGVRLLYGGSMKPENAGDLLRQEDIDGGLIGGASLKASDFGSIIQSAAQASVTTF